MLQIIPMGKYSAVSVEVTIHRMTVRKGQNKNVATVEENTTQNMQAVLRGAS